MRAVSTRTNGTSYVIPSRTLSGSTEQMLAELDEAVEALLAVRHLILVDARGKSGPGSLRPATERERPEERQGLHSRELIPMNVLEARAASASALRQTVAPQPGAVSSRRVQVVLATTVFLTFISFWRAAAIVSSDLGSSAFYVGGIAEEAVGKSAPWFILGVMLFSYAVGAVYIEDLARDWNGRDARQSRLGCAIASVDRRRSTADNRPIDCRRHHASANR